MTSPVGTLIKSSLGALFVQIDGPNTKPEYMGCVDADDLSEPGGGIDTIIRCFSGDGQGWNVLDYTRTPPDPVTTNITALLGATQSLLDRVEGCAITLFFQSRETGQAGQFTNYVRSTIVGRALIGDKTRAGLVMREEDTQTTKQFAISALPPVYEAFKKITSRQATALTQGFNSISFCNSVRCATNSAPASKRCQTGFAAGQAGTGAKAFLAYTTNYGQTWTATAAQPFANDEHINALTCFEMGNGVTRVVAMRGSTDAAAPAEIAYSDDFGATWTAVNVGSTNALFGLAPHALFAIDQYDMWAVTGGGHVAKSEDGGATWTQQHAGVLTSQNLHAVHFATDRIGAAVGAAGAVLTTVDGGLSWSLKTAPVAAILRSVFVLDAQRMWVGSEDGRLYYTIDGGTTWSERLFTGVGFGSGVGTVRDVMFFSDLIGFMASNNAGPVGNVFYTIDGGYTWEQVTTLTNTGINQLAICGVNDLYAVGPAQGGTSLILKVQAKQ